jgi:hypothetical protein
MTSNLTRWLLLPSALFALTCALLGPVEPAASAASAPRGARRARQEERQTRTRGEAPSVSAVRGRVVYDDTSRPVRRARVLLLGDGGMRGEYSALTDGRGEFRIDGVTAGSYFVFVNVPGVLSPIAFMNMDDLRRGGGPGIPDIGEGRAFFDVVEVNGKEDVDVTVHARRGATIAGRVTYADGDPAVNVTVNLMRRDGGGRLQKVLTGANIVSLSGLRTDDRGMFRLTGLPPGEYIVCVYESVTHGPGGMRPRADDIPGMVDSMMGQQLLMTFHPSATSPKQAAVVKVAPGDERTDVDVRIPERELRTVSGVVRKRRDKSPLAGAQVSIVRRDDPLSSAATNSPYDTGEGGINTTTTDEEGRWWFTEIPDGPYTLNVKPAEEYEPGSATAYDGNSNLYALTANSNINSRNMNGAYIPPRRKRGYAPARRDVEVSGGDLSDVEVETADGGRITGVVTVEGGGELKYASVMLVRVPDGGDAMTAGDLRNASVESGRFSFDALPAGRFFLQPKPYMGEASLYVKSVNWNGKDLTRESLELGESGTVEGVRVVLARDPATLRLTAVRAADRKPAPEAFAFLVPVDAPAWSPHSAGQLFCSTDEEGSCLIKAPPGEYHVVVLSRRLARDSVDVEVRRRAPTSPRVVLRVGETKEFGTVVPDK